MSGPATGGDSAQQQAEEIIGPMRQAVTEGRAHWFAALLQAIGRWSLAREQVGERTYSYLIGGEAFDWLLLAERLCEELDGLISRDEAEELLFHGRPPLEMEEEEFRRQLGSAKYRAHLNFVYGVRVEEALQLAVTQEVHKERLSRVWENGAVDDEVCRRIYGATRGELFAAFRGRPRATATGGFSWPSGAAMADGARPERGGRGSAASGEALAAPDRLSLAELTEFTYWLFRYRLRYADPAKVASDTRKGLALFAWLEERRLRAAVPSLR